MKEKEFNKKEREFELEIILTAITKAKLVDDLDTFWDFIWYVFDDKGINLTGLLYFTDELNNYLLDLYPQLKEVKKPTPKEQKNIADYIKRQKEIFGDKLVIPKINQKKKTRKRKNTKKNNN